MVFLDFDGVLFDTVREAYAVAVITTGKYDCIDNIDFETKHYQYFKKLRYLISPAWNYKYLLEELESYQDINIIKDNFIDNISRATKDDYVSFENNFFETRSYLRKNHYEKWFRLNIPFPFLNEVKFLFFEFKNHVYIITTKDKATVSKLLSLEGIEFDEDRIYDKEDYAKYGDKKNVIESLILKNSKNIFIDDSDNHIKNCSEIKGLNCIQPDWGYVGLDSQTISHKVIINEINSLLGR